jgi:spermidine synthase
VRPSILGIAIDRTVGAWTPRRVDRRNGRHGELALIEAGAEFELVSNGTFLMDTRDGRSERHLVDRAVAASPRPVPRLLVGGLGVGFSLAAALAHDVEEVVVVECEAAVIAWNRDHTGPRTGGTVAAPGVRCVEADLVTWLRDHAEVFDVICLDVDNGPDWLVGDANAWLYGPDGLTCLGAHLTGDGVLAVWSAARAPAFAERLHARFSRVVIDDVPVARGVPDVVYVAQGPRTPGPDADGDGGGAP